MMLQTTRLSMALLSEKDAPFIFELLNTERWIQYIGDRNIHSVVEAVAYIKKIEQNPAMTYWTVTLTETGTAIGLVTLIKRDHLDFKDIGFAFLPQYFGRGYAYEATRAVLQHLADEDFFAVTLPDNKASLALIKKLGFKFQGEIRSDQETLHLFHASKIEYSIDRDPPTEDR